MKKIINKYLVEGHFSTDWLGFLRIAVAVFALLHFLSIQPDFNQIFSYGGFVQPDILDAMQGGTVATLVDIHSWLVKIVPSLSYDTVLQFARFFYIVSLLFLAFGLFTRVAAVCSLLIQLILINSIHYFQYGADSFTTILLFYCLAFPTGKALSLDNRIFRKGRAIKVEANTVCLRVLQLHLCIVYFIGGLDKLLGDNWRNGEAFWKAVTSHNLMQLVDLSSWKNTSLFLIGGWGTVLLELLYPIFIHIRQTRKLWLALTIGMHIGIVVFLGLSFFATLMILFNLAAFYVPYTKRKALPKHQNGEVQAAPVLATG